MAVHKSDHREPYAKPVVTKLDHNVRDATESCPDFQCSVVVPPPPPQ